LPAAIDHAIALVAADPTARPRRLALTMLIGLRSVITPDAPPPAALVPEPEALAS
jgi:hypothetical protein